MSQVCVQTHTPATTHMHAHITPPTHTPPTHTKHIHRIRKSAPHTHTHTERERERHAQRVRERQRGEGQGEREEMIKLADSGPCLSSRAAKRAPPRHTMCSGLLLGWITLTVSMQPVTGSPFSACSSITSVKPCRVHCLPCKII